MMSIPIDPIVLGAIIFIGIAGTASGWIVRKLNNDAINQHIPFAATIRKAVTANKGKKPKSIIVMMQPGTYTGEVLLGDIDEENHSIFDFSKYGIGEHLVPETYVKPIILDGLRVYFASYVDAELMGIEEIRANNRLKEIHAKIPKLRGIPIATLNTLLQESPADWEINCSNLLYQIRTKEEEELEPGTTYCGIPDDEFEFVELLEQAKQMLSEPTDNTSDYIITTFESVIKHKTPAKKPKQPSIIDIIEAKLKKKPLPKPAGLVSEVGDTYQYKSMLKGYRGIKFLAPSEAMQVRDSSLTVSAIQQYGMQMEQRGRLGKNSAGENFMEKYGKYLLPVGIFVFICCVGLGIVALMLPK